MNTKEIVHLYWRVGFGITNNELDKVRSKSKSKIIENLFSKSKKIKPLELDLSEFSLLKNKSRKELNNEFPEKEIRELRRKSQKKVKDLNYAWIDRLSDEDASLREKMVLFWANVFVCRDNNIFHIQQYNNILREYALGDFKAFVKAIAKTASMSKYLNNRQNVKKRPNENFARELMELFTLGIGNYTEQDIKEAARAFTGWSFENNGDFKLRKKQHDFGKKTFLGKTGNFNGEDIIDIILEQRQCARFICAKIYTYFVNPVINEKYLEEITTVFYKEYDILKLMSHIFNSRWFYNDENIGVKIKSPLELLVGIRKIVPITFHNKKRIFYLQKMMGQVLLYPKNVSGWKGNKSWIDSNTLMFRMKLASVLLNNSVINLEEKGDFEDSFEKYYKTTKKKYQYIKTTKNWEDFKNQYGSLTSKELRDLLIISKLDKDTEILLNKLDVKSNKDYCVQLMSIPEYQLC